MEPEELERLSREELLELIRRQQDELAERDAAIERRGRKWGPKRGHVGVNRVRSTPDVVVECRPTACAGCGVPLSETGGERVVSSAMVN